MVLHAHKIFLRFSSFHKIYFPHRRQHRYKHPITSTLNKLCVFNAFSAHQQDWQIWKALKTDQGRREKQDSYHTLQAILQSTYPWLTESLRACIGLVILSLSSWDHLRAPATWGMFLLIGGVPSLFATSIWPSNIILASSSSSSYIFSKMGYLYSKSAWISGRSSKDPKQSSS